MRTTGTLSVRPIGGLWIQGDLREAGDPQLSVITLGFDPGRGRFVGTFVSSMQAAQWLYDGELDEATDVLVLDSEGESMAGDGSRALYHDIFELLGADRFVFRSETQTPAGEWVGFMRMTMTRQQ
jgi:hypothetical protein